MELTKHVQRNANALLTRSSTLVFLVALANLVFAPNLVRGGNDVFTKELVLSER